jgi:hypothetical protein
MKAIQAVIATFLTAAALYERLRDYRFLLARQDHGVTTGGTLLAASSVFRGPPSKLSEVGLYPLEKSQSLA